MTNTLNDCMHYISAEKNSLLCWVGFIFSTLIRPLCNGQNNFKRKKKERITETLPLALCVQFWLPHPGKKNATEQEKCNQNSQELVWSTFIIRKSFFSSWETVQWLTGGQERGLQKLLRGWKNSKEMGGRWLPLPSPITLKVRSTQWNWRWPDSVQNKVLLNAIWNTLPQGMVTADSKAS